MTVDPNALGERGERMLELALTTLHDGVPLFRPRSLGGKWPVCDFIVELWSRPGRVFLLQAKTSSAQLGVRNQRLPIDIGEESVGKLLGAPIPAYLVGVQEFSMEAYLCVPAEVKRVRSVTSANALNDAATRLALQSEVNQFWDGILAFAPGTSQFTD